MTGVAALAFLAGALSTLSPCVLPLLPLAIGAAAGEHRLGPIALALGVASAFVGIGLFLAGIGYALGFDGEGFRRVAALVLAALGVALLVPRIGVRLAAAGGPLADWADGRLRTLRAGGLGGQFVVGLLLGALWSPCAGPTLGAASALAAEGHDLGRVALTLAPFGLGAAAPLLLLAALSREALLRWRGRLALAGGAGKALLGLALVALGAATLTGFDRQVESALVDASPAWLTTLTTRF